MNPFRMEPACLSLSSPCILAESLSSNQGSQKEYSRSVVTGPEIQRLTGALREESLPRPQGRTCWNKLSDRKQESHVRNESTCEVPLPAPGIHLSDG